MPRTSRNILWIFGILIVAWGTQKLGFIDWHFSLEEEVMGTALILYKMLGEHLDDLDGTVEQLRAAQNVVIKRVIGL